MIVQQIFNVTGRRERALIRPSRYVVLLVVPVNTFFVSGCATARLDVPEAMKDSVRYESGCPVLISDKTNAVDRHPDLLPEHRELIGKT